MTRSNLRKIGLEFETAHSKGGQTRTVFKTAHSDIAACNSRLGKSGSKTKTSRLKFGGNGSKRDSIHSDFSMRRSDLEMTRPATRICRPKCGLAHPLNGSNLANSATRSTMQETSRDAHDRVRIDDPTLNTMPDMRDHTGRR